MKKISRHFQKHVHDNKPFVLGAIGLAALVVLLSSIFIRNQNTTYGSRAEELAFSIPWQFNYPDLRPDERDRGAGVNYAGPTAAIPSIPTQTPKPTNTPIPTKTPTPPNTPTPTNVKGNPIATHSPTPLQTGKGNPVPTHSPTPTQSGGQNSQPTPTSQTGITGVMPTSDPGGGNNGSGNNTKPSATPTSNPTIPTTTPTPLRDIPVQFSIEKTVNNWTVAYVNDSLSFTVKAQTPSPNLLENAEIFIGKKDFSKWSTCPYKTTSTTNTIWCKITTLSFNNQQNGQRIFTYVPETAGDYYIVVNGKALGGGNMCSGNPQCDFNGGASNCTVSGWYTCGANANLLLTVRNTLTTATPLPTPKSTNVPPAATTTPTFVPTGPAPTDVFIPTSPPTPTNTFAPTQPIVPTGPIIPTVPTNIPTAPPTPGPESYPNSSVNMETPSPYCTSKVAWIKRVANAGINNGLESSDLLIGLLDGNNVPQVWTCPPGTSATGASGKWCMFNDIYNVSVAGKTTFSNTISWTPAQTGTYVIVVNAKNRENQLMCSGNPECTINGGGLNCGATWNSCGSNDSIRVTVEAATSPNCTPPTATPTSTPVPPATPVPTAPAASLFIQSSGPYTVNNTITIDRYTQSAPSNTLESSDLLIATTDGAGNPIVAPCPAGTTVTGASGKWCMIQSSQLSTPVASYNTRVTWTPGAPGNYVIVVNAKNRENRLMCSGNPDCRHNSSNPNLPNKVDCTAANYYDCGSGDFVNITVN